MLAVVFGFEDVDGKAEISDCAKDVNADAVEGGAGFLRVTAVFRGAFGAFLA